MAGNAAGLQHKNGAEKSAPNTADFALDLLWVLLHDRSRAKGFLHADFILQIRNL